MGCFHKPKTTGIFKNVTDVVELIFIKVVSYTLECICPAMVSRVFVISSLLGPTNKMFLISSNNVMFYLMSIDGLYIFKLYYGKEYRS
jgi:hypothetical protein